jgi:hypothetical protein
VNAFHRASRWLNDSPAQLASLAFRRFEPRSRRAILGLLFIPPLLLISKTSISRSELFTNIRLLAKNTFLHIAALILSAVAYRLSPLHPLAKYPGPWQSKVSRLWALKIASGGDQHRYYHTLHEKYGPVVRTGPNHLHVREQRAVPVVMGKAFRKGGRTYLLHSEDPAFIYIWIDI